MATRLFTSLLLILLCASCGSWNKLARTGDGDGPAVRWLRAERPDAHEDRPELAFQGKNDAGNAVIHGAHTEAPMVDTADELDVLSATNTSGQVTMGTTRPLAALREVFNYPIGGGNTERAEPAMAPPHAPNEGRELDPPCLMAFIVAILAAVFGNLVGLVLAIIGFILGILGLVSAGKHDHWGRGFAIAAMVIPVVLLVLAALASENGTR